MISYPFTSQVTYDEETDPNHIDPIFDRGVSSSILRVLDKQDYTDGVCINPSTCFKVSINTGMNVTVGAGSGRIQGVKFYEENDRVLQVQASESLDRIDTVVLRLNDNILYRNVDLYILKGTAEATPVAPILTRTSSVYELGIANIFIAKNTTTITQERITDTRQDAARCGYSMPIQTVDTTALYNQYEDAMDTILEGYENAIDGTTAGLLDTRITTLETETYPISRGGTGATTASAAIANLNGIEKTTANITYYVSPTGSNANNGLSSGAPFLTIDYALSKLPQCINHTVTINLAAGTYTEPRVLICRFIGGGTLGILGDINNPNSYVISNGILMQNNSLSIGLKGIRAGLETASTSSVAIIDNCGRAYFEKCSAYMATLTAGSIGFRVTGSTNIFFNTCVAQNFSNGITCSDGGVCVFYNGTVPDCSSVFFANSGIILSAGNSASGYTTLYTTTNGGIISKNAGAVIGT